jgi:enoyl-CoA hydratase
VIEETAAGDVVVVRLAHGKANAVDLDLAMGLADRLEELARSGVRAVVLTGTGSIFSAGVDLFKLVEGGAPYVERFLPALDRLVETLFMLPAPIVAAVNGHAIAGGCIIACACDRRVFVDANARIGLPELHVGVPFPPLAVEIMRNVVAPPRLEEMLFVGRTYEPAEARDMGLVDELAPLSDLPARARAIALEISAGRPASFRLTKRASRLPFLARARASASVDRQALLDTWASDETLGVVRAYLDRTLRKE